MTRTKRISVFAAVFAVLTMAVTGAFAAQATTTLNVRDRPNGYVVDVLSPGEEVQIIARYGGWCQIEHRGPDGWSSCRYLTESRDRRDQPDPSVSFSFGTPGFSIQFGDDDRWDNDRRDRRPHWERWEHRRDRDCFRRQGQWYCPVY